MSKQSHFDHERLNVYQASVEFVAFTMTLISGLSGEFRNIRDQLIRASQSIPLNIAEGNGKRSAAERRRFFEIARGSAMESAACLDVLVAVGASTHDQIDIGKELLVRIVSMLSKMTEFAADRVREDEVGYLSIETNQSDYEHEHEHEHEHEKTK